MSFARPLTVRGESVRRRKGEGRSGGADCAPGLKRASLALCVVWG